jgi:membrane protein DedA with SNARE-associated domain
MMNHIPSSNEILIMLSGLSPVAGYSVILGVLILCGFGLPLPEDVTLLFAGFLAATHKISICGALVASFTGVFLGDSILFALGRKYGKRLFAMKPFSFVFSPATIEIAEQKIIRNQHFICFIGRFVPGLRACIFALVGSMGVRPKVFLIQDGLAALVSVPIWVFVGFYTGENWDLAIHRAHEAQWILISLVGTLIIGYLIFTYFRHHREKKNNIS